MSSKSYTSKTNRVVCQELFQKEFRDLFDEQTRIKSNVNGKKKERLDPEVIKYIKQKCFYYCPLSGKETEDEGWKLCIISMDENLQSLKNKPRKATH